MVAERVECKKKLDTCCSLAKISMVAELPPDDLMGIFRCSLAKISMVAEPVSLGKRIQRSCSLAKISMVAERGCSLLFT